MKIPDVDVNSLDFAEWKKVKFRKVVFGIPGVIDRAKVAGKKYVCTIEKKGDVGYIKAHWESLGYTVCAYEWRHPFDGTPAALVNIGWGK